MSSENENKEYISHEEYLKSLPSVGDMEIESLAPGVVRYKKAFNAEKLISLIEKESSYDWPYLEWSQSQHGDGMISEYRSSVEMYLDTLDSEELAPRLVPIREEWSAVWKGCESSLWDYRHTFDLHLTRDEGYRILKYENGGQYLPHVDHSSENGRVLSLVAALNDDFTGGELNFPLIGLTVKPEAGSCLFFPSNYVYVHTAAPVGENSKERKYSLVTWFK